MKTRFLEVQDAACTNHGKFLLGQFGEGELAYASKITGMPLLASLPPVRRFGGAIQGTEVLLLDLQTQEGLLFDPLANEAELRRRFLVHPLHVCILFFPAMRVIAAAAQASPPERLPGLITIDMGDVLNQPGLLLDAAGQPVRGVWEWSERRPLAARLRNRRVEEGTDPEAGQGALTLDEGIEQAAGKRPAW